ncbi:MAG: RNA-binding protein [Cardiobacteriaceae bacterium]|nr:RNA-binding protein [Cardiobacteriaceae bacterium]
MINIYVGNLSYQATEQELRELFASHGEVGNVTIIKDRDSGRSKGFAFVEMNDNSAGLRAIDALNGKEISGRALKINEARPREARPPRRDRFGGGRSNNFGGGNSW